jgi:hypothetical protein
MPRPLCGGGMECPLDFTCDVELQICRRSCMGDPDCGPGEACESGVCSGAQPCTAPEECPSGLTCEPVLGFCRPAGGGLCAECQRDADCGGPSDFCLVLPDGRFCGRSCADEPCPEGYSCVSAVEPPQCVPEDETCGP